VLRDNEGLEPVRALKRRISDWVVRSSGPKGFSRFPSQAWSRLPQELSYMREFYVSHYLYHDLGLEPGVTVDVHGA
jgi:hypothetical protein